MTQPAFQSDLPLSALKLVRLRLAPTVLVAGLLGCSLVFQVAANAGPIFRCENQAGVVEYSNSAPAGDEGRRCQQLELPSITTIPAPATVPARDRSGAAAKPDAGFPKVSAASQKSRDDDRARILADELKREQEHLTSLQSGFNGGEPARNGDERNYQKYLDRVEQMRIDIARHESNVEALQRELDTVKR